MKWNPPLIKCVLKNRYKRFLSDIEINETRVQAHVPNTGPMTSCWEPDWECAVSESHNPNRKLPYTLELTSNGESWIGVNTANANKVFSEWVDESLLEEFTGYKLKTREVKTGKSRLDFFLSGHPLLADCYIEVKSVTLKKDHLAQFPDTISTRAQKHVEELIELKEQGFRAALVFIVQRGDVNAFKPAHEIDPQYEKMLKAAILKGVEIYVYRCKISLESIHYDQSLPLVMET
jgi:sugar fermentation stimulation protein A